MRLGIAKNPSEIVTEHFEALRHYIRRAIVAGEELTQEEEADKDRRLEEYLAIGTSFKCTAAELTVALYDGFFDNKPRGCDCPSCKTRRSGEQTVH